MVNPAGSSLAIFACPPLNSSLPAFRNSSAKLLVIVVSLTFSIERKQFVLPYPKNNPADEVVGKMSFPI